MKISRRFVNKEGEVLGNWLILKSNGISERHNVKKTILCVSYCGNMKDRGMKSYHGSSNSSLGWESWGTTAEFDVRDVSFINIFERKNRQNLLESFHADYFLENEDPKYPGYLPIGLILTIMPDECKQTVINFSNGTRKIFENIEGKYFVDLVSRKKLDIIRCPSESVESIYQTL